MRRATYRAHRDNQFQWQSQSKPPSQWSGIVIHQGQQFDVWWDEFDLRIDPRIDVRRFMEMLRQPPERGWFVTRSSGRRFGKSMEHSNWMLLFDKSMVLASMSMIRPNLARLGRRSRNKIRKKQGSARLAAQRQQWRQNERKMTKRLPGR